LLEYFSAKVGKEDVSKPTTDSTSLHEIEKDNGVRIANFVTSKYSIVKRG
jgi:hypothetical protein